MSFIIIKFTADKSPKLQYKKHEAITTKHSKNAYTCTHTHTTHD